MTAMIHVRRAPLFLFVLTLLWGVGMSLVTPAVAELRIRLTEGNVKPMPIAVPAGR